jgi:hypothetical protein
MVRYNKKCPTGVFCIENITLMVLGIFLLVIGIVVFQYIKSSMVTTQQQSQHINHIQDTQHSQTLFNKMTNMFSPFYTSPNALYSRDSKDIYLNPYAPPLKENPFFESQVASHDIRDYLPPVSTNIQHVVPINVNTRHRDFSYKQVGILTRDSGSETILALFGRPLDNGRDKWQYYTIKDGQNMVKLPVSKNGRSCTSEYGCNEIYNGDSLFIEGYKDNFNAVIYENDQPRYIPL